MSISKRLFAAWYDLLNSGVEGRVVPYRRLTAGIAHGDVLEIGGGTGANLPYYPHDASITFIEPDKHMVKRLRRTVAKQGRDAAIIGDSTIDIEAGRAAGFGRAIAVSYGYHQGDDVAGLGADHVIDDMGALPAIVAKAG